MHYGGARRRDHHLRLYVCVEISPQRPTFDGVDAVARRIKHLYMGAVVPFGLRLFIDSLIGGITRPNAFPYFIITHFFEIGKRIDGKKKYFVI